MNILGLENVHFLRNDHRILEGVSWTVRAGEHWAILGANGSGKTTLLKIVTGYEWASEGSVQVLGREFGKTNLPELRKIIGWVSSSLEHRLPGEDRALQVVMSGFDATLGVYRSFDGAEHESARSALTAVGGVDLADKRYNILSQGEQQRVLIARAMVSKPALLILDEPCAGLDPAARHRFLADLSVLARSPGAPTFLFVTHHIEEIGDWISNVLILKQGRVLAHGVASACLQSDVLSDAFSMKCQVSRNGSAFQLQIA
ncbi:MAG TPA: ABC transporter ATP-binding protein [Candidatus Hydrogenedentes bacterium]|nr:ABC transporter ATP-binding protein [Candidatus Hydrogenedentota bacterium]